MWSGWWASIHCDWCPDERRLGHWQPYTHAPTHMWLCDDTRGRWPVYYASWRERPQRKPTLLIPWFWTSSFQTLSYWGPHHKSVCWAYGSNCLDPGPSYGIQEGRIGGHCFFLVYRIVAEEIQGSDLNCLLLWLCTTIPLLILSVRKTVYANTFLNALLTESFRSLSWLLSTTGHSS